MSRRPLVLEAIRICNRCGYVSPSRLRRELGIGYELSVELAELVRGPARATEIAREEAYYRSRGPDPFVIDVG